MSRFVAPLVLLAACFGSKPEPAEPPAPPRDTLVIGLSSDFATLNPVVSETTSDSAILENLLMPTIEADFDCKLTFRPSIATEWAWAEDGKAITITMRDDLSWSDGTPLTAHDVKMAYTLAGDPTVGSPRYSYLRHMEPGSPEVTGDHTLVFRYTHAYDKTTQLAHANLSPVPRHIFESADRSTLRGHPRSLEPLSNGPWQLTTREPSQRIVIEPNPAFAGGEDDAPRLRRVVFRVLPEYTTRLGELRNGGIDLMEGIEIEDADGLKRFNPELNIVSRGYRSSEYLAWNLNHPIFKDREVRRAIAMAVDVQGLIDNLLTDAQGEPHARRAVSTITPELCGAHASDIKPIDLDIPAARELLASRGWVDTDGDGVLDKDGKPFRFRLSINSGNKRRHDAAVLIQDALKSIGIRADLEVTESNAFFASLRAREFDAAIAGWNAALFIDPTAVWKSDPKDGKHEFNFTGYSNPEVDDLIDRGLDTPDPAEAAPIWREMQAKIYEDQPYLFLWWREELVAVHERFDSPVIDILSPFRSLNHWDVPADKVKYKR